ncbi:MAG: FAD-dependent oxidoreductase [Cryobacterium sp.]
MDTWDVVVVGAGVCGLTIAHTLSEQGRSVVLLDKGSRPGGRLASRPLGGVLMNTSVDTVRVRDVGVMHEISRRTGATFTPTPVLPAGVESPVLPAGDSTWVLDRPTGQVAALWAAGTTVQHTYVTHIEMPGSGVFHVRPHGTGDPILAAAVVVTAPVPQSREILLHSAIPIRADLANVAYEQRIMLLCVVDGPEPDETVLDESKMIDLIRLRHREENGLVWLELFATALWSSTMFLQDSTFTHSAMLVELRRLYPGARVMNSQLKQWRYANPRRSVTDATFEQSTKHPGIYVAGDGFGPVFGHPSGVENAVRSGLDVSRALLLPR